jgi:glycosyltransferase involved in cell wall biosynthesis
MPNRRTLCIDLRWIDCSGVGVYIKGILPGIVGRLKHVMIIGLGDRSRLSDFDWSRAENVRLVDCRAARYSLTEQIQLPYAIPNGVDLFFSPYYTIPLLYRGRFAVTVHDMSHLVLPEIVSDVKKRIYAQTMYRALRKRASTVFAVSNFTKGELLRLSAKGRADNVIVTPLGVAPEWYEAARMDAVHRRPYFICVGNVKPHKNIGRLVSAYLQIMDRVPHDLILAGQTDGMITGETPEFFERVRAAGPRVHMTGVVSDRELLSLVGHADALVMPSLYEGFGLPPLEAMAAGVPVLAARAASMPEVCGEAALYFDPKNVEDIARNLVRIASDPDLCTRMREAGRQRSRQFTWESCASITAGALETCLDAGQS